MIKIISDSTCDLSKELLERYDITILPLHVHLGENEYEDGINITPDELYEWSDANKSTPKTSVPSIEEAIQVFQPYVNQGAELICFSISTEMSSSANVMRLAAEEMEAEDKIHVVNSANLSTGIGLLAVESAVMASEGKSVQEILDRIEELKPLVRSSFVVDIMTYLHRGGRCSAIAALAGGVLKLHPEILVEDGKMKVGKKYRGKMKDVLVTYVKDREAALEGAKKDRVFITHSGCDQAVLDSVHEYLESLGVFDEILLTRAGSVISSHCGPGTLGVLYIAGE